jgi:hypothetical protein
MLGTEMVREQVIVHPQVMHAIERNVVRAAEEVQTAKREKGGRLL